MSESTQLGASIAELTSDVGEMREKRQTEEAWLDDPKGKMMTYAREVAAEYDMDIDWMEFDFRVSQRTKRHGAVKIEERVGRDPFSDRSWTTTTKEMDVSINVLKNHGVEKFKHAIRHELIHVWQYQHTGSMGHGSSFDEWADQMDVDTYATCRADDR